MIIFGLDCSSSSCRHDSVRGYRLRFQVRRDTLCTLCGRPGSAMTPEQALRMLNDTQAADLDPNDAVDRDKCMAWWACTNACGADPWRRRFRRERNDLVFRPTQLDAALAQMQLLGVPDPRVGGWIVERHHSLPPGHDARALFLTQEAMPRTALYFRWQPMNGDKLTRDNVFQCVFTEGATAAERRTAPERALTDEELLGIVQFAEQARKSEDTVITNLSKLCCQHCQQPLPLAAFNTLTLRQVEKGD